MINNTELIDKIKSYNKFLNSESLNKAYNFALDAHQNQKREEEVPYIIHPVAVANILTELFSPLKEIDFKSKDNEEKSSDTKVNQILIEELQLSVRAYNCLKRAQIHSVADLLDYSQEDLIEIKNFGQKSAEEVIDALQKRLGINLPKERTLKSM